MWAAAHYAQLSWPLHTSPEEAPCPALLRKLLGYLDESPPSLCQAEVAAEIYLPRSTRDQNDRAQIKPRRAQLIRAAGLAILSYTISSATSPPLPSSRPTSSIQYILLAVVITFLVTATAANVMRCYTRIGIVKAFGVDDWFMLIAHFWWLCYIWYGATMMFSKISIGVFILRVTTNRYHAWTARAITVLTTGSCGAFILVTMFQCTPISAFWEEVPGVGQSSCIHGRVIRDLAYIFSAGTLLIDLTLVVLPLVIVWKLKMSLKTKFGLSFLIFSGLVASVGVAVRFAYLDDLTQPDFLSRLENGSCHQGFIRDTWATVPQSHRITTGGAGKVPPCCCSATTQLIFLTQNVDTSKYDHEHRAERVDSGPWQSS
ncbi:hypothetical protein PG991_013971 [Apiospora marii]|uniref:Rhodopsin domain-containing protein n=1 Tax=Apiospora marii TaxID=335849 RepID=A0ABR1R7H8_9PEZI